MAELTYTVTVASGNLYGGGTGNVFYLDGARNYLDAELNEPKAEPVVSDEVTSIEDPSGVS